MSDEVIWQVINHQFCAFKIKTDKGQNFCRNEYNVSGLCNRQSCPLANARYATVKNIEGRLYLYMKTAERAHLPSKMWERIKLLKNYNTALEQIDERLKYWQKFLIHKCKQRLTRLTQVAITERRMAMREDERHYVGIKHKVRRREEKRERKALSAAKIEKAIEKELLDRLKSGAYGDKPLNVDDKVWKKILSKMDNKQKDLDEDEDDDDVELVSDDELEDESDIGEVEYVEDDGEDELVDVEDLEKWLDDSSDSESEEDDDEEEDEENNDEANDNDKRRKATDSKRRKKPRVEVEYEQEEEPNDIQTNIVY